MTPEPWTFEALEMDQEITWDIYDPNTARLVASFRDYDRAREYLAWINRQQAKKKADKKARKTKQARHAKLDSWVANWYTP